MTDTAADRQRHSSSNPRRRGAGSALIASAGIYFTAEFVAAAAWSDPPYSYTHHFISNLGVHGPATAFGQFMYSPLAWVMNTGFFLFGPAALTGTLLLRGLTRARRRTTVAAATLLAAGSILVALFPGSGDETTADYHGVGALVAFMSGNVLSILIGSADRSLGLSPRLGRIAVGLGALGLVAVPAFFAVVGSEAGILIGLVERAIVYPFLISFSCVGAALRNARSTARRPMVAGEPNP